MYKRPNDGRDLLMCPENRHTKINIPSLLMQDKESRKKIKQLLQLLLISSAYPYFVSQGINGFEAMKNSEELFNPHQIIDRTFTWSRTYEGHNFWALIHSILQHNPDLNHFRGHGSPYHDWKDWVSDYLKRRVPNLYQ